MSNENRSVTISRPDQIKLVCMVLLSVFVLTYVLSCDRGPGASKGFNLPVGSVDAGEKVFEYYRCRACHSLQSDSQQLTDTKENLVDGSEVMLRALSTISQIESPVTLGGDVGETKTYADLVTSIINPSHKIAAQYQKEQYQSDGQSKMKNYNYLMTVSELIDLVAFLQPHYKIISPVDTVYNVYP